MSTTCQVYGMVGSFLKFSFIQNQQNHSVDTVILCDFQIFWHRNHSVHTVISDDSVISSASRPSAGDDHSACTVISGLRPDFEVLFNNHGVYAVIPAFGWIFLIQITL